MDLDTAWCPVCDRAILPKRIQVPVAPTPVPLPARLPKSRSGTIKARPSAGGLVNGTGRGLPRRQEQEPATVRMRTIVSQEPTPYYCSEECRIQDLESDLFRLRVDAHIGTPDLDDDDVPLRVPANSPADRPPSPLFLSSGTDSDSSAASYSPSEVLRHLPPLRRKPSKKAEIPVEYPGGIMMAAHRIQAALNAPLPPKNPHTGRREPVVLPGWTDGDRTQWRASVYGGCSPDLSNQTNEGGNRYSGSYSIRTARRPRIEEQDQPRAVGRSAPQQTSRNSCDELPYKRTNSSSQLSTSSRDKSSTTPEESIHPLRNTPMQGRLLVPQLRHVAPPPRSSSSSSLASIKPEPAKSPLSQETKPEAAASSWSHFGQFTYPIPSRYSAAKQKRSELVWVPSPENKSGVHGLGEGKWEKRDVEVPGDRKRLFLFAH